MPRKSPPKDESKAQRFERLANARVPRALKAIELVANLGAQNYGATFDQREAGLKALEDAVSDARRTMHRQKASKPRFLVPAAPEEVPQDTGPPSQPSLGSPPPPS